MEQRTLAANDDDGETLLSHLAAAEESFIGHGSPLNAWDDEKGASTLLLTEDAAAVQRIVKDAHSYFANDEIFYSTDNQEVGEDECKSCISSQQTSANLPMDLKLSSRIHDIIFLASAVPKAAATASALDEVQFSPEIERAFNDALHTKAAASLSAHTKNAESTDQAEIISSSSGAVTIDTEVRRKSGENFESTYKSSNANLERLDRYETPSTALSVPTVTSISAYSNKKKKIDNRAGHKTTAPAKEDVKDGDFDDSILPYQASSAFSPNTTNYKSSKFKQSARKKKKSDQYKSMSEEELIIEKRSVKIRGP